MLWLGFALVGSSPIKDETAKLALMVTKPGQVQTYRFWFLRKPTKEQYPHIFARSLQQG
jgi:hypothetical protein